MPETDQNELASPPEEEISHYRIIKWKSLRSASEDKLKDLLSPQEHESAFDDTYIVSVAERWRELQRTHYRFAALLFFLVLFMGVVNSEDIQEISLFGVKISSDGPALGVLLLIVSILMFFVTIVSLVSSSYGDIIKSYVEARKSEEVSKLYLFQFGWSGSLIFGGTHDYSYRVFARAAIVLSGVFLLGGIISAVTLISLLQFYLFISSIISVQSNPQLPGLVNVPIVIVAVCAVLFSVCAVIVRVPLPYSDYSNLRKLRELELENPDVVKRIRMKIAKSDLEKERRNVGIWQLLIVMIVGVLPQVALTGERFFSDYYMLVPLLTVPLIVFGILAPILNGYERRSYVVQCDRGEDEVSVDKFVRWKRQVLITRLVVCFFVGVGVFLSFWHNLNDMGIMEVK